MHLGNMPVVWNGPKTVFVYCLTKPLRPGSRPESYLERDNSARRHMVTCNRDRGNRSTYRPRFPYYFPPGRDDRWPRPPIDCVSLTTIANESCSSVAVRRDLLSSGRASVRSGVWTRRRAMGRYTASGLFTQTAACLVGSSLTRKTVYGKPVISPSHSPRTNRRFRYTVPYTPNATHTRRRPSSSFDYINKISWSSSPIVDILRVYTIH